MIKLIIVEDENIVRLGLSTILPWEEYHFELCGLFKNGQEALNYLLENPVDIVLTDIKMPVMGGDQLVQEIKAHSLNPFIVILSNYDDFELVKRCFQFGVTDYLLKQDLEKDVLLTLLQGISEKIEQTEDTPCEPVVSSYEFFNELVKTDFREDLSQLNVKYQKILKKMQNQAICICMADLIYSETGKRYTGIHPVYSVLETLLKETLNKYCKNYIFLYTGKSLLFILCPDSDHISGFYSMLTNAVKEINERMISFFNISLRMGASQLFFRLEDLRTAFCQAQLCHTLLFYSSQNLLVYSQKLQNTDREQEQTLNYLPVRKAIHLGNFSLVRQLCEEQFKNLERTKNTSPDKVIDYVKYILIALEQFLNETFSIPLSQFEKQWDTFHKDYHFDLRSLHCYLFRILNRIDDYMKSAEEYCEAVFKAKQYINEHYRENITLSSVAEHLHMNTSYVSSLFKLKTDVSFTQYLTDIRIQNALMLVRTTNKSAAEISELVGYSNPNYFIKVFKKVTGSTISEYRSRRTEKKSTQSPSPLP